MGEETQAPIEMREATLGSVEVEERIIEVVAVPYGQDAVVEYRKELWRESFERGAFDGLEGRPPMKQVKVNRDHDKTRLVGKAVEWWPDRDEGLVGAVKVAATPLGDETLQLAREGVLGVSVGFGVRGRDQVLDRETRKRSIRKAFLDHLAFVADGAYEGAGVLAVRRLDEEIAADLPKLDTPYLDDVVRWLESRRT